MFRRKHLVWGGLLCAWLMSGCAQVLETSYQQVRSEDDQPIVIVWQSPQTIRLEKWSIDIADHNAAAAVRRRLQGMSGHTRCQVVLPAQVTRFGQVAEVLAFVAGHVSSNVWLVVEGETGGAVPFPIPVAAGLDPAFVFDATLHTYRPAEQQLVHINESPPIPSRGGVIRLRLEWDSLIRDYRVIAEHWHRAGRLWFNELIASEVQPALIYQPRGGVDGL